jgi:hypothetical protein
VSKRGGLLLACEQRRGLACGSALRCLPPSIRESLLFCSSLFWTSQVNTVSSDGPATIERAIRRIAVVFVEAQIRAAVLSVVAMLGVLSSDMVSYLVERCLGEPLESA